ncbi:MAG: hypothetical protein E7004_04620 [Alphaproteobacteria bacterium]|nr:hypothetical protein [Alphaproteobacteria bacterium]
MVRRSESDDYLGPAKGVMKWINKLCRFVLFPFIHPLVFVILLAVLGGGIVGIHYYFGVAYKDIPSWVLTKSKEGYQSVAGKYNVTTKDSETADDTKDVKVYQQPVVYDKPTNINRKAFKKAQEIPIDVKATVEGKNMPDKVEEKQIEDENDILAYKKDDSFGLVYVENPRVVRGNIEIVNVNEVKVNGEVMFLYGVYAKPSSSNGMSGATYLQRITENKDAECHIVAFTQNADLTAICIVDGKNINHQLVKAGYSQNIGLK